MKLDNILQSAKRNARVVKVRNVVLRDEPRDEINANLERHLAVRDVRRALFMLDYEE